MNRQAALGPRAALKTQVTRQGFAGSSVRALSPGRLLAAFGGTLWELDPARRQAERFPLASSILAGRLGFKPIRSALPRELPGADCWFGFLGYEAAAWLGDGAPEPLPARRGDLPDLWLMKPRAVQFADSNGDFPFFEPSPAERAEAAWIGETLARLAEEHAAGDPLPGPGLSDPAAYRAAVGKLREYLLAGDIYQANLTRRVQTRSQASAEALSAALERASPASHAALLDLGGGFEVASSSPELFLRLRADGKLETRPIKGTLKKAGPASDPAEAEALRRSAKDRAEHVMIVDLERNDLGRIAEIGSVRVPELLEVLDLPRLWHLESAVEALPLPGVTTLDAALALFPGGSITGAPKIRAMQVVRELEPARRGAYTGAIGWIGPDSLHLNVAIRTLSRTPWTGWSYHVGGGIVIDSTPEGEWEETETKALGMEAALRAASAGGSA